MYLRTEDEVLQRFVENNVIYYSYVFIAVVVLLLIKLFN